MERREFTVADAAHYDQRSPVRWIAAHLLRYKRFLTASIGGTLLLNVLAAIQPTLIGGAFTEVLRPQPSRDTLGRIALTMFGLILATGLVDITTCYASEFLAKRLERDARDELYRSLLGKSQTFHNRQRVGDIMARAANDIGQINSMIVPGLNTLFDSFTSLSMTLIFIGILNPELLLTPVIFTVLFGLALRHYVNRLRPVAGAMREQFGLLNAGLTETVTGIEVVKTSAQEAQEATKFLTQARRYRDLFVQNGTIQARYLPPLLLSAAIAGAFLHGALLVTQGRLPVGGLVTYLALMGNLRFPVGISIWTFNLAQLGLAAAERILALLREETELDENAAGHSAPMRGEIVFDHVTFRYGDTPVLQDVSFRAAPGQTVAIVGQTGSGKSTLTKLVNRIYDIEAGRILVDGIDVREWSLDSLRGQVSTIEQDIVLFSRSIAENIGFSRAGATAAEIEAAAADAQADGFIRGFKDGYATVIGERGVTLSGGQRQRLAIARALLTDPRILILDDSTSAIDSATEDLIQAAIRRLLQGRTTLLITHRLSQIRWADRILVLEGGRVVDQGTHDELLARCDLYRRIFAHHRPAPALAAELVSVGG